MQSNPSNHQINPQVNYAKEIYLSGGCFWGVEAYFSHLQGVKYTSVGYANTKIPNPSYELVCTGATNATECVRVVYDETCIVLEQILEEFFGIIDPTLYHRQGNDIGSQYRSGVYFTDLNDEAIITSYLAQIAPNYRAPILTEIAQLTNYYLAESYHQQYLQKNPNGYCHIDLSRLKS